MGKTPYVFTDSETEDTNSCSSIDNKAKKKFSILKCTNGNMKKKKCRIHSKSEPEDSDCRSRASRSRSNQRVRYKLPGILKKTNIDSNRETSEDEEDSEPFIPLRPQDRYLVGTVPRPPGSKPGRGGGLALIVKKNISWDKPTTLFPTTATPEDRINSGNHHKRAETMKLDVFRRMNLPVLDPATKLIRKCVQGPQSSSLSSGKSRDGQKRSWLSRKRSY